MKMSRFHCHRLAIFLWFSAALLPGGGLPLYSHAADSKTAGDSLPQDIVKVGAWVENGSKAAVTEQVSLIVEVATPTWFTQGTRIKPLEISDAVIFQAHPFAVNFTRQDSGKIWSVQQWTVIIHGMKEKTYVIPGIEVTFFTVDEKARPISGRRFTPPVRFQAIVPGELVGVEHWVATSQMTVRQWIDEPLQGLNIGDAVKWRVEIQASDLPAMLLPVFSESVPQGLAIYQDPPKLIDEVNRGVRIGKRVESMTVVIEKPGAYRIPGRVYAWWNVQDQRMEIITTPDHVISTAGFEKPLDDPGAVEKEQPVWPRHFAVWTIIFLFMSGMALVIAGHVLKRRSRSPGVKKGTTEKQLRRQLKTALKNQDHPLFLRTLYTWFDFYGQESGPLSLREFLTEKQKGQALTAFNHLMAHLYEPPELRAVGPVHNAAMKKMIVFVGQNRCAKFSQDRKPYNQRGERKCFTNSTCR